MPENEEKIVLPSTEEWHQLYAAAVEFKQTAPWEWMRDSDIFGVQNPLNGEIGYCCVLGRNKEVFGLAVYLGTEGLDGYLKVVSGEVAGSDPDALHTKKCLLASFENKEYLSKNDLVVIKQLGLQFSGENAWPQFHSYRPGYLPWQLMQDEAVFLTLCLRQAIEFALRFKESPDMLTPPSEGYYLIRIPKKHEDRLEWEESWLKPKDPLKKIVIMVKSIDESRLDKLKHTATLQTMIWQIEFFYAPAYVAEKGKRPYYPLVLMCADQESYYILSANVIAPAKYRIELVEFCLRAFESAKILPKEIQVRKEELFAFLRPLTQRLGIEIKLVKKLQAIDEARKSMNEHLGKRMPK